MACATLHPASSQLRDPTTVKQNNFQPISSQAQEPTIKMQSILILAVAASAMALPAKRAAVATSFVDTFESLPAGFAVGRYHGLVYGGVNVDQNIILPNVTQAIQPIGQKYAGATTEIDFFQTGAISQTSFVQFQTDNVTSSFDLTSFYAGCFTDDGFTEGFAQGCTLAVSGYKVNGDQVPITTFSYAPTVATFAKLSLFELGRAFKGLQNATIGVATGATITDRTALAIDDVTHTNYA